MGKFYPRGQTKQGILEQFPGTPRDVQREALLEVEKYWNDADIFLIGMPVGCHTPDQRVLLADGTVQEMRNVKVGDQLLGPDGKARNVLEIHSGISSMLKVVPRRGESYVVTSNHVWPVSEYVRPMRDGVRAGKFETKLYKTEELLERSRDKANNQWLFSAAQDFEERELIVDPYILGLWLGDGTSRDTTLTTIDREVKQVWQEEGNRRGLVYYERAKAGTAAVSAVLSSTRSQKRTNSLLVDLKALKVRNNKHIPHVFKVASRSQRLQLLAGIVDTDGHVDPGRASIEIIQKRETLMDDILFVARSLGYSAQKRVKVINGVKYFRTHISGTTIEELPLRIPYKKEALLNSKSNQTRRKFRVEEVGEGQYVGVTVDGDNLYLLEDFTVTHNSGKSRTAVTIARWARSKHSMRSALTTPTRILTNQYAEEFPTLAVMKGQGDYLCETLENADPDGEPYTCKYIKETMDKFCSGKDCCYMRAMRRTFKAPYVLGNYYTYLAQGLQRDLVLFDEAHQVLDFLRSMAEKKLWKHDYNFPSWVRTYATLQRWVESHPSVETDAKLKLLKQELNSSLRKYVIVRDWATYRGEDREALLLKPIDVRNSKPVLWPEKRVRKLVFLSATMNWQDIKELGLDRRRVHYIEPPSPIPAERRPVTLEPLGSFSYRQKHVTLPLAVEWIGNALKTKKGKGIIHVPYAMASELKELLPEHPRLLTHTKEDKLDTYNEFRARTDEPVLLASGLYEGIDLAGEDYTWQAILKVPFPSLAEPAIKYRAEEEPAWYLWETLKVIIQACGRICRGADDYGETIILDSDFKRVYHQGVEHNLLPRWWQEAYTERTVNS